MDLDINMDIEGELGAQPEEAMDGDDTQRLPLLPLRDMCVFPGAVLHFEVGRKRSVGALEAAMAADQRIVLAAQLEPETEYPAFDELYHMGTIARIKQVLKLPGGELRVLAEGIARAELTGIASLPRCDVALVIPRDEPERADTAEETALIRLISAALARLTQFTGKVMPRLDRLHAGTAADLVASSLPVSLDDKQRILAIMDRTERLERVYELALRETEVAEYESSIRDKVKKSIEKSQREYYLREQLRTIQSELDGGESAKLDKLREQARACGMSGEALKKVLEETDRLEAIPTSSPEYSVARTYVQWLLDVPWTKATQDSTDIRSARRVLDEDHFGLERVKERVLEYLAVKTLTGGIHGPILCFVGPPGVGKTSIARSIARALGREFVSMSLGGIRDEAEIRGHRRTYIGAIPGRIISMMKQAGTVNPVILFDEIDKMANDFRGDPASAMLEVLDPAQNQAFRDNYLDVAYDLSKVLFLTTANTTDTMPRALLDRMEVIRIEGYTDQEKAQIARRHLIPRQISENGLAGRGYSISSPALDDLIAVYTREAGVRQLEREIARVCRRSAWKLLEEGGEAAADNAEAKHTVRRQDLPELLGPARYHRDRAERQPQVGVATGLAWTAVGGVTLQVEVSTMPGKGEILLTGQLGDVMKESARAALSYIRMSHGQLGIDPGFYSTTDIHIHIPEGATPKDGPSAGVTLALAMASALTGRTVRQDVAMTGEVTLRGRVLAIGGLREKTLAAYRAGIYTVLYPQENRAETAEIPERIRERVKMIPVTDMRQVFEAALMPAVGGE